MKKTKPIFSETYSIDLPVTDVKLVRQVADYRGVKFDCINVFYLREREGEKYTLWVAYLQLRDQGLYVHNCANGADFTYLGTYLAIEFLERIKERSFMECFTSTHLPLLASEPYTPKPTGAMACK